MTIDLGRYHVMKSSFQLYLFIKVPVYRLRDIDYLKCFRGNRLL